jgi:hypothetical protein
MTGLNLNLAYSLSMQMEAVCPFEMSGFLRTTQRYNPEDLTLHSHHCESLKSNLFILTSYDEIKHGSDFTKSLTAYER